MSGVRERLLAVALRLFYRQGYNETGLKQILQESKTARASFYDHFPSKGELGLAYLIKQNELYSQRTRRLMQKYPDVRDYVEVQVRILRRATARADFYGCALANFATALASPDIEQGKFQPLIHRITDEWCALYAGFFRQSMVRGDLKSGTNPEELAVQFKTIYEGALILWRMSGKRNPLEASRALYLAALQPWLVN